MHSDCYGLETWGFLTPKILRCPIRLRRERSSCSLVRCDYSSLPIRRENTRWNYRFYHRSLPVLNSSNSRNIIKKIISTNIPPNISNKQNNCIPPIYFHSFIIDFSFSTISRHQLCINARWPGMTRVVDPTLTSTHSIAGVVDAAFTEVTPCLISMWIFCCLLPLLRPILQLFFTCRVKSLAVVGYHRSLRWQLASTSSPINISTLEEVQFTHNIDIPLVFIRIIYGVIIFMPLINEVCLIWIHAGLNSLRFIAVSKKEILDVSFEHLMIARW